MTTVNALIKLYGEFAQGGKDEDIRVLIHMLTDDKDLKEVTPDGVGDTLFAVKELNIWRSGVDVGSIVYDLCENGGEEFKNYLRKWSENNEDLKDEIGGIINFISRLNTFMEHKYKKLSLAHFFVDLYSTLYDGSESATVKTAVRNFTSYEKALDRDGETVDRLLENDTTSDLNIVRRIKNDIFISEHNMEMSDFYCAVKELFDNGLITQFKMEHAINLMKTIVGARKNSTLELREAGIKASVEVPNKEPGVIEEATLDESEDTSIEETPIVSDEAEVEEDESEEEESVVVHAEPVELEQDEFNLFDLSTPEDLD